MAALTAISPVQVRSEVGPGAFDFKGSFRDFYTELTQMLKDYGNPDKDMVIGGIYVPHDEKYSAFGVMVFDTFINQIEQRQETLFNAWTSMYQLEKTLGTGS